MFLFPFLIEPFQKYHLKTNICHLSYRCLMVQHTEAEIITRHMVWAPSFLFSSAGDSIFKTSGFHKPWHLRILSFFESWKAINSFWMWTTFSECGWTFNFQCPALEISSPHLRVLALNNSYLGEVITNFFLLCVLEISNFVPIVCYVWHLLPASVWHLLPPGGVWRLYSSRRCLTVPLVINWQAARPPSGALQQAPGQSRTLSMFDFESKNFSF